MKDVRLNLNSEFAAQFAQLCAPWSAAQSLSPETVWVNDALAAELGLDLEWLHSDAGMNWLIGKEVQPETVPVAQVYAGHQFGYYAPRLGDGRALLLGELTSPDGSVFDIHLKGSGPTPFSRGGDGFATLGAMLREAIMGESLHALGVPTSRALAVVKTGRWIARDGEPHPAAILVRVAASHLRVGTFEFVCSTGDKELLARLVDYALRRHYPHAVRAENQAFALLENVIAAQAKLVAGWMLIGFVHGVMNTDNVTIAGETIDYGPCAMLDYFDERAVFSSIDHSGRYAYGNQPAVMQWNMARFAESLLPLLGADPQAAAAAAEVKVREFMPLYEAEYERLLHVKLAGTSPAVLDELRQQKLDFTTFFRRFSSSNPLYIARNHLVGRALDAAEDGDLQPFLRLLEAVSDPATEREGFADYAAVPGPDSPKIITTCGT